MTFNDQVALGVLSAFRDFDVAVPGRISIIGCDDSLPDGLAWPALTTVDGSAQKLGALTAEGILDPLRINWVTCRPGSPCGNPRGRGRSRLRGPGRPGESGPE